MAKARGSEAKKRTQFEEEALPHLDALYQYARHLTRHDRDAEDLVQDTYVKAYRFWDKYEPGTNCKAWLFRIMTNTFLKNNRRNVKEFSFIENVDQGEGGADMALEERSDFYRDPERDLLGHVVHSRVRKALEELPADFRTVVLLADLQDFTYKEIAEVMDCPVGTVMSRLFRARKALQRKLLNYALQEGYIQGPPQARRRTRGQAADDGRSDEQGGGGSETGEESAGAEPTPIEAYRNRRGPK